MMIIRLSVFLIVALNPNLSENLPGEWVGGNGFSQSPAIKGNVLVNPALTDTQEYLSVDFRFFSDDYTKTEGSFSSAFFNIPFIAGFSGGGSFNVLYNSRIAGSNTTSYGDYTYINNYTRTGGVYSFGGFIGKSLGDVSLGMDINLLNGKIEDMRSLDFQQYNDVYDTVNTYFRGYSVGLGIYCNFGVLSLGGYYCPYQNIETWEVIGEEAEFELDVPLRFGFNYSFSENKSMAFSIDRKEGIVNLNYGFLKLGYGRIYSMGNGVSVEANRFLGGISFEISDVPVSIILENKRYLGNFTDNQYIVSIGFSILGKGRKNEKEF